MGKAGEPLEKLRDITYLIKKIRKHLTPAQKRAKASAWMKTLVSGVECLVVERILRESGKYDEDTIQQHIKWAEEFAKNKSNKNRGKRT